MSYYVFRNFFYKMYVPVHINKMSVRDNLKNYQSDYSHARWTCPGTRCTGYLASPNSIGKGEETNSESPASTKIELLLSA